MMRRAGTFVINSMLRVLLEFKERYPWVKSIPSQRLLPVINRCIVDKDLFASEFVIRSERNLTVSKRFPS